MLQAKNSQGKLVTLAHLSEMQINDLRKTEKFYCPECNNLLIVRAGPRVIPHFAHKSTSSCLLSTTGESAIHQQAKLILFQWLRRQQIQVHLEVYLPDIQQRPDLLCYYANKTFAIEFQHTTTNIKTIRNRNEGYKKLHIIPIWILGAAFLQRTGSNRFHVNDYILQFIHQFSPQLPTSSFYFSPEQQIMAIVNDIHVCNRRKTYAAISYYKLSQLTFKDLFIPRKISRQQLFSSWKKEKQSFRLGYKRVYGQELRWRRWLYDRQLHLDHLPSIIHLPTSTQHFFKVPPWNWQSRFILAFLHPLAVGQIFTISQVETFLRPYLYSENEFPLLSQDVPYMSYLYLLETLKYIKVVGENTFMKRKEVKFYAHIEEAIKRDGELLDFIMYNHN